MNHAFKGAEQNKVVVLEGELTIQNAAKIWTILKKALKQANRISIQFKEITEVDLSFLQVFYAAQKIAAELKKECVVKGDYPELLRQAEKEAGYIYSTEVLLL